MKILSKTTLLGLLLVFPRILFTQNEAQKWYFGYNAGLDFSTNPPTVLTNGAMRTDEGSASISNSSGNLLFYTDGITVYNQLHAIMANGTGLMGNGSTTQSAIIVKKPGSASIYYIFTLDQVAGANGLNYSEVDMSLAAGMGSVTVKNYSLFTPSCEKMVAVRHCNGADVWVVTHDWNSSDFRSYLVTAAGVSLTPVISSAGAPINGSNIKAIGQMKVSPNGKKLGLTVYAGSLEPVELFDFDAASATVSNPLVLENGTTNYGCEFSPDGTKFYSAKTSSAVILQWDICAGTNPAILASKVTIPTNTTVIGQLQLSTDGKIYIARMLVPYISVINSPNTAGAACNFIDMGIALGADTSMLGLPNFINNLFKPLPQPFTYTSSCSTYSFNTAPIPTLNIGCGASANPITGILWDFGDPASGAANSSTLTNPSHTYQGPGTYTTQLVLYYACSSDTIRAITGTTAPGMSVAGTFTVCKGDKRVYTVAGASSYTWSAGGIHTPTISLSPTVTTTYSVTGTGTNSCINNKFFTVTVNNCNGISETEINESALKIYPNPASHNLTLETESLINLKLINHLGEVVFEAMFESGKHFIDLTRFNSGIYTVQSSRKDSMQVTRLLKME